MKKIKTAVWAFLNWIHLGGLVQLALASGLKDIGWFRSFEKKQPVDKDGNPLPWYCYSIIAFLDDRLTSDINVFEYGAGFSTLWYSKRVNQINAVENSQEWVDILTKKGLPDNVFIDFQDVETPEYVNQIMKKGEPYSLVVVDGRRRVDCLKLAVTCLTDDGVVILDNSEREEYAEGLDFMRQQGFRSVFYRGIAPIASHFTNTTIFYRNNNCLGI